MHQTTPFETGIMGLIDSSEKDSPLFQLKANVLDESACKLVSSYFTGRIQSAGVTGSRSDWRVLSKENHNVPF